MLKKIFFLMSLIVTSENTWAHQIGIFRSLCPVGYVRVPALPPYTTDDFCVMKYEAKDSGTSTPVSVAAGTPWVNIPRGDGSLTTGGSWKACRSLGQGYDLISNNEWQTIARNIADNPWNWQNLDLYNSVLNSGYVNGTAGLDATTDDLNGCYGTGQSCPGGAWNASRRTHKLSNGFVIWDLGGNVSEQTRDYNFYSLTADYIVNYFANTTINKIYGNDQVCTSSSISPYCSFGYINFPGSAGYVIHRGSDYTDSTAGYGGIFRGWHQLDTIGAAYNGFRCVYRPERLADPCYGTSPAPGTNCSQGTQYAGIISNNRYMVTKSNCTDSTTPTCDGATDSLLKTWGGAGSYSTTSSNGFENTALIDPISVAAKYCGDLVYGGYDDWYLPASGEYNLLYTNRTAIGGFFNDYYWTSQTSGANNAMAFSFLSGSTSNFSRSNSFRFRCIRRF